MRRTQKHLAIAIVALCLGLGTVLQAGAHEGPTGSAGLGDVHFSVACTDAAQAKFHRAMALYHSFDWPRGKAAFDEIASLDPRCGMAHWGLAMIAADNPFGWPRRLPKIRASSSTTTMAKCWSISRRPTRLRASLDRAVSAGVPLLIGTTGLIDEHEALIAEAAQDHPDPARAQYLARRRAARRPDRARGARAWARIGGTSRSSRRTTTEKADAPSGTALQLGAAADQGRGGSSPSTSAAATAPASSGSQARSAMPRSAAARSPATMT